MDNIEVRGPVDHLCAVCRGKHTHVAEISTDLDHVYMRICRWCLQSALRKLDEAQSPPDHDEAKEMLVRYSTATKYDLDD